MAPGTSDMMLGVTRGLAEISTEEVEASCLVSVGYSGDPKGKDPDSTSLRYSTLNLSGDTSPKGSTYLSVGSTSLVGSTFTSQERTKTQMIADEAE